MTRRRSKFILAFFGFLLFLAFCTILLPSREFSENENRTLTQAPAFSIANVLSGEFQSSLSDYLSDQILLREWWFKASTALQKCMGAKEINQVYLGKDHYYFQKFTDDSYSANRMRSIFSVMEEFSNLTGLSTSVMLVPTSGTILTDKLPNHAPYYDADKIFDTAKDIFSGQILDLRDAFLQQKDSEQLYYRTDHHWTSQGAYLAYQQFCTSNGTVPQSFTLQEVSDCFYGTLYSKLLDSSARADSVYAPADLEEVVITYDDGTQAVSPFKEENLSVKDKYTYFFGGNYGMISIRTDADNDRKLLIIKDSFANSFVPFLFKDYAEIVMVDLRYFEGNLDDVLQEYEFTQLLFLYEISNLLTDTGIVQLAQYEPAQPVISDTDDTFSLENALFIGDSRTVALADYANLDGAAFFATIGTTVYDIWDNEVIVDGIGKTNLQNLLSQRQYKYIYLMSGINELGYRFEQTVTEYETFLATIQELQPDAVIILMANLHVTADRSSTDTIINNPAIDRFNEAFSAFADGTKIFYLDANPLFDDENGNLEESISSDSAHLLGRYCVEWGEWIIEQTETILSQKTASSPDNSKTN